MDKMVYRQNGIGQNGTDKMVRTKWYGKDFTNKIINQYMNSTPIDNVILTLILLPLEAV